MNLVKIYTDGSHLDKQNNGRLGCGGVMINGDTGKLIDKFSEELTPRYLQNFLGTTKVSNPTAEMLGAYFALKKFNIPKEVKQVIIFADYQGVKCWNEGSWKIKEPYIKIIKQSIDNLIKIKNLTGKIKFEWVRGHQNSAISIDAYWNGITDKLAKGENE